MASEEGTARGAERLAACLISHKSDGSYPEHHGLNMIAGRRRLPRAESAKDRRIRRGQAQAALLARGFHGPTVASLCDSACIVAGYVAARSGERMSIGEIAYATRLGERTVQLAIRILSRDVGLVVQEDRIAARMSLPNRYMLEPPTRVQNRDNGKGPSGSRRPSAAPPPGAKLRTQKQREESNKPITLHADECRSASGMRRRIDRPDLSQPVRQAGDDVAPAYFISLASWSLKRLGVVLDLPAGKAGIDLILKAVEELRRNNLPEFAETTWARCLTSAPLRTSLALLETLIVVRARATSSERTAISNPAGYLAGILFNRRTGARPEQTLSSMQQAEALWHVGGLAGGRPKPAGQGVKTTTEMLFSHADPIVRRLAHIARDRYGAIFDIVDGLNRLNQHVCQTRIRRSVDLVQLAVHLHEAAGRGVNVRDLLR